MGGGFPKKIDADLVAKLRKLVPGQRVHYRGWRDPVYDRGQGVFLKFLDKNGNEIPATSWGIALEQSLLVKRDFSADSGRAFKPLLGDGDMILTDDMLVAEVHEL